MEPDFLRNPEKECSRVLPYKRLEIVSLNTYIKVCPYRIKKKSVFLAID